MGATSDILAIRRRAGVIFDPDSPPVPALVPHAADAHRRLQPAPAPGPVPAAHRRDTVLPFDISWMSLYIVSAVGVANLVFGFLYIAWLQRGDGGTCMPGHASVHAHAAVHHYSSGGGGTGSGGGIGQQQHRGGKGRDTAHNDVYSSASIDLLASGAGADGVLGSPAGAVGSCASAPPRWLVTSTRWSVHILMHGCIVPMTGILASPLVCGSDVSGAAAASMGSSSSQRDYLGSGLTCWSGAHIGLVATSVALLPLALVLLILAAIVGDRNPDTTGKKNLLCQPHGRVTAAMIFLRAALSVFALFPGPASSPWVYAIVMLMFSLIWAGCYISLQPYWNTLLNCLQAAFASVAASAAGCTLMALGL